MERGLIWLPLIAVFFGLAGAGWYEFQKLNACQRWAADFERYKYDIACVLGQRDRFLIWGKPTRQGPTNLQQISLDEVQTIQLYQNDRLFSLSPSSDLTTSDLATWGNTPSQNLGLHLTQTSQETVKIPFTDFTLALAWGQWLNTHCRGAESPVQAPDQSQAQPPIAESPL
ncbi:MAG: hypothetical protein ACOYME_04215 [Prochlorotrichaceae cyanobacterium]